MFHIVKNLILQNEQIPNKLINFYGYQNLDHLKKHINKFDKTKFTNFDFENPIKNDFSYERFILYNEALNNLSMLSLLGLSFNTIENLSIDNEILSKFPPTFNAAPHQIKKSHLLLVKVLQNLSQIVFLFLHII